MTEEQKAQIQALRAKIFSQLCKDLEEIEEYIEKLEEVAKAAVQFLAYAVAHYTEEVEFYQTERRLNAALNARMSNFEVEADLLEQDFKNMYVQWGKYSPARTGMHASAILDKEFCTREQVLKEFYPEQGERAEWNSWDWKKAAIFENGWRLHQRWQDLFLKCAHVVYSPVTPEQIAGLRHGTLIDRKPYAPELDLTHHDEERNIYFSPDAIIQFGPHRYVIEIKGIKQESYSELTSDLEQACSVCETVHKAREQANLYMHLLGLTRAILLIENKNTCDFKLYVIGYERERAQQYIDRIYSAKKYIALTKAHGRAKWPERVCTSINDPRAKKCPMRTVCFSIEKESEKLS